MTSGSFRTIGAIGLLATAPALALAQENGVFAGISASGGSAHGTSDTKDGGAVAAGGGVVGDVAFDRTVGIGGHAGYRFNTSWSAFLSIDHARGGIDWEAAFPLFDITSDFEGEASSTMILGNLVYDWPVSDATLVTASAGVGLSVNSLSDIVETDRGTGLLLADVAPHRRTSPAAQIRVALRHRLSPRAALGLNLAATHVGDFETGDTRSGNLGVTEITPYAITDVWRASLGAGMYMKF